MIRIENTDVYGWDAAIHSMRNPKNSWAKSDTQFAPELRIGENDLKLMKSLVKAGSDHRKFLRFITVTCDIVAPLYWIAEHDTYKVSTVRNSCSKMHKLMAKPFELDDFSFNKCTAEALECAISIVDELNNLREKWLNEKSNEDRKKLLWYSVLQLLPDSYNQRYTWQANYEVLCNQYHARKNHKLDEWHEYCHWIETLPYAKELICE